MRWVGTSPWSTGWGKRAAILIVGCIFSPLPTLRQMPLRWSRAGLWMAPPHTKTWSARMVSRSTPPPGWVRRQRAPTIRSPWRSSRSTRQSGMMVAPAATARGTMVRDMVCLVPRPVGVVAEHPGELDVAPAQLGRAPLQGGRGRRRRPRQRGHRQLVLDPVGVALERLGRELVDGVGGAPLGGQVLGEPVVEPAVDLGAPTHAPALDVGDGRAAEGGGQAVVTVLGHHLLQRERLQGVGVDPGPLLDHA